MDALTITPDGGQVVEGAVGRIHGWSIETGEKTFVVVKAEPDLTHCVGVSADGPWLASGTLNKLRVWKLADLAKNPQAAPSFEKQTPARWLQFDKATNHLWTAERHAAAAENRACCWDLASGQLVSSVSLRGAGAWMCYALSPDGRTLAAVSGDNERMVQLYDTRTGNLRFSDNGHTQGTFAVAFSPEGRWLASGSADNTVRVWDLATGGSGLSETRVLANAGTAESSTVI